MKDENFNPSRWIVHVTCGITWMLLFPSAYHYARAQSGTQPPENNELYTTIDPSMTIIILVLICTFFFVAVFSIYVRHCSDSRGDDNNLQSRAAVDLSRKRGIDPAVIETFPIFVYSAVKDLKIGKGTLECAVCLSEFEDDETLRLLPKCDHVFHPDCIDAWLASHVTCPVCRAVLTPESKETVKLTDSNNEFNQIQNNSTSELGEEQHGVAIDISNEQSSDTDTQMLEVAKMSDATPTSNWPPRLGTSEKFPRSHSTGHSLVLAGVNTERYTLKLPEEVRKQLMMSGKLKRTVSFSVVLAREGSSRKGAYRSGGGEGSSRGRNYADRQGGRSDRWVFSMTPPFVSKLDTANSATKCGGEGEGLSSTGRTLLTAVKSPLNCLNVKVEERGESSSARPQV